MAQDLTALVLFSGLAADSSVFTPQKLAFPQLIVPAWPTPRTADTLDSYCDRIADDLETGEHVVIGGASFGGIIALHVARSLKPLAVVLIGSVRSPAELSLLAKLCRPLKPLVRLVPVRFMQFACSPLASDFARRTCPHLSDLARQFRGSDPMVFKWSLSQILGWHVTPTVDCPIFHVHGDRDYVLPMRNTQPDTIVSGGGHVISLTHASEVNEFIRSVISEVRKV